MPAAHGKAIAGVIGTRSRPRDAPQPGVEPRSSLRRRRLAAHLSHVPLSTYFHSVGSLSTLAPCAAHACFAVPQSFCPALATP
jgi:hypothetical protein